MSTTLNLDNIDLGSFGVTDDQSKAETLIDTQRERKFNATMNEALKVDPDKQAKINQISRDSGVPTEALEKDFSDVEHDLKLKNIDIKSLSRANPVTTRYLNNFNNASIAHDDIESLRAMEDTISSLNLPSRKQLEDNSNEISFTSNLTRGVGERVTELLGSLYNFASQAGESLEERFPIGGFVFEDSLIPRYASGAEWKRLQEQGMEDYVKRTGDILKETDFGYIPRATWESTKEAYLQDGLIAGAGETLAFGLEQGTHSLADMVATVYALPTYILARSQEIGEQRAINKNQKEATFEETIEAMPFAVGSAVLERILPNKVFKGMGRGEVSKVGKEIMDQSANRLKDIMRSAGSGLITEASTEAIQEGIIEYVGERWGTDAELVLIDALDRAAGGAVGGGVAGGALAGTAETINVVINTINAKKVDAATDQAQRQQIKTSQEQRTIDKLNEQASESKLQQRDPEAFRKFVESVDGDNNTTVFIDGLQTKLYLADKNIEADPALQLLNENVNEAAALGNDVQIPVADFSATIAGTEHFNALRDFMTLSGDTMSPFRQEQVQQETQNYIQNLINEAQESTSQYVESQQIFESVRDQLVDSGTMTPQNASVMAQIVPAWAAVYAQQNGMGVLEAYQQSGLFIEGPQTGELSRLVPGDQVLESKDIAPITIDPEQIQRRLNQEPIDRRQSDTPVEQDRRQTDRRRDQARRDRIAQMTPEEQYRAIYQHELTGLNNRRAFEEDLEDADVVVSIDVDSLKAVNDNLGHDAGDNLLKAVGKVLHETTNGQAYHISGDEFFVLGDNQQDIENQLRDAQEALKTVTIQSDRGQMTGIGFTPGFGTDKKSADEAMESNKEVREESGERVGRGERPPGMNIIERFNQDTTKQETVKEFADRIVQQYQVEDFFLIEKGNDIELANFIVHKDNQRQGIGTIVMKELTDYADNNNKRIILSPGLRDDRKKTTSRSRLVKFYKRFGFIENKGRNKDFTISKGMYRDPNPKPSETFQQGETPRGYYDPANSVIRLTESSDLSTFLHEFAHFMYEMELRSNGNHLTSIHNWFKRNNKEVTREANTYADENVTVTEKDVQTYLDNDTTGNEGKDRAVRRAVHEQFARGFETYLMEGKAPSIELRNAFRSFARWLSQIYQAVRGRLNVNLDEEMREVFGRLLATEEQINAAEARAQYAPMFTDAAMAGMTEEEFNKYKKRVDKVKDIQAESLRDKLIKEITRQTRSWWKEERADLIDEEMESLANEQVYRAINGLRDGEMKLDHATVKDMIGEQRTDKRGVKSTRIPSKLNKMTVKGAKGVHPDEAAAFFGYNTGAEMLNAIVDAVPIRTKAEANAEERMLEKYGDILHDGTIEQQADEAVQNEERGKLLLDELKVLRKGTSAPILDRQQLKNMAEENIGKLSFRQIHPTKYRRAEIRAAQEAAVALNNGDREAAARAKTKQVLNYYLGMEATKARNETIKIVDRMARYNKKKVREEIQKAGNGYWEQLNKILRRFEFRKTASLRQVDQQNENINVWAKERMETDGDALVLTPAVLDESYVTHWKNVPFTDLQGVNDSVKNIEHVARYANKITLLDEEMQYKKLRDSWVDHIEQQKAEHTRKDTASRVEDARRQGFSDAVKRWNSQLTKIPFMASWLDGGERVGLSHQILMQRLTEALGNKFKLMNEVATPVFELIESRSKEDVKRHMRKIHIPEINDHLTGEQVVSVALNTGNVGNLKKLLLGEGWANPENESEISYSNPKLQAVLKHMNKSDWDLVQKIWDQMELLYPQLAEVHRRTTGLTPPKVEATPIINQYGNFRGGYYPVKYSPRRSHRAEKNAEKLDAETESMFNNTASIHASVTAGATNERTGFYDRINLNLGVVPEHFNETIHYITHHDAVRQINKLIQDPSVADAITGVLGKDEYAQLKPWLNDVAKDGRGAPVKSYIDEVFQRLRFGVTLGVMGFKASTGIMQVFGLLTTAAEVGPGKTIKAVMSTVGRSHYFKAVRNIFNSVDDIQSNWKFASEKSKVLNHRTTTMDRELRNAMERLAGRQGITAAVQEASMKHIALIQTYMVDLPTWIAAYDSKLTETGDETIAAQYGDWAVENLQGSGATKDMAALMRSQTKLQSTFTMFMTFFSSLGNLTRDLARGTKSGLYSPTTVTAKLAFLFALPVFLEMLMRGEFDDDDDDKLQKFSTAVALYPLTSVPLLRDVASGLIGDYGYNMTPIASVMESGLQGMKQADRLFTDEEITKSAAKNTSKLAGAALAVPGVNQAWATGEHLYDVMENGEELTMRELLFGPDRER